MVPSETPRRAAVQQHWADQRHPEGVDGHREPPAGKARGPPLGVVRLVVVPITAPAAQLFGQPLVGGRAACFASQAAHKAVGDGYSWRP